MFVAINKITMDGKEYFSVIDSDDMSVDLIDKQSIQAYVKQTCARIRWLPNHAKTDYGGFMVLYPKENGGTVYVQTKYSMLEICQVPGKFSFSGKVLNSLFDLRITLDVSGNKIVRMFTVSADCVEDTGTWRLNNEPMK